MELTGVEEGPEVGKVKRHLSELVVEGVLDPDDLKSAEREASSFVSNRKGDQGV